MGAAELPSISCATLSLVTQYTLARSHISNGKDVLKIYRVTINVVPNLPLTSKQKYHFSMKCMY